MHLRIGYFVFRCEQYQVSGTVRRAALCGMSNSAIGEAMFSLALVFTIVYSSPIADSVASRRAGN